MIRSAGIAHRHGCRAEVLERFEPQLENRNDSRIFLRVDSADFSGAVIEIEVSGQLRVLGLERERAEVAAERGRQIALFRRRLGPRSEMFRYVSTRSQESFFFAAP